MSRPGSAGRVRKRPVQPRPGDVPAREPEKVDAFIATLSEPHRAMVQALRKQILGVDGTIGELAEVQAGAARLRKVIRTWLGLVDA